MTNHKHCITCKHEPETWALSDPIGLGMVGLCRCPKFRTRPKKERDIEVTLRGDYKCCYAGQEIRDCRGWERK